MYQPASGKSYSEPLITIDGTQLKSVAQFCYLGSTLSSDALIDKEVIYRISRASISFGRLSDRVWKQHGIKLDTKIQVYKAVVLSNQLYG